MRTKCQRVVTEILKLTTRITNEHQVPIGTVVPADVGAGGYMKWSNEVLLLLWHDMPRTLQQRWFCDAHRKASFDFVYGESFAAAEGPGSKRARQAVGTVDRDKSKFSVLPQLMGGSEWEERTFAKRFIATAPVSCGVGEVAVGCSEGPETNSDELPAGSESGRGGRGCVVCWESDAVVALHPCGHVCLCVKCAPQQHTCPMCRAAISGTLRVFLTTVP